MIKDFIKSQLELTLGHIKLLRPQDAVDIAIICFIGFYASGKTIIEPSIVSIAISFVFLLFFVHIQNDISDTDVDKINTINRPIATGLISKDAAGTLSYIYLFGAFLFSFFVGLKFALVILMTFLVIFIYSKGIKTSHRHLYGTLTITIPYTIIPFLSGFFTNSYTIDKDSVLLVSSIFLVTFARMLLKDKRDVEGDLQKGKITPLIKFGPRTTKFLAVVTFSLGTTLFYIFLSLQKILNSHLNIALFLLPIVIFILLLKLKLKKGRKETTRRSYTHDHLTSAIYIGLRFWLILILILFLSPLSF